MRVGITHTTRLTYSAHVVEGVMDVRLGPRSDAHQRWQEYDLRTTPTAAIRRYYDGFGNAAHLVTISRPHDQVELVSHGVVETVLDDPFRLPLSEPSPLGPSALADYLTPSAIVPSDPALEAMAAPFRPASPNETLEAVQALMGLVYREFQYEQHVTTVATTVPEVLKGRTGVCQDFAHVLIGLCRAIRLPARYVSGYIVPRQPSWPGQQAQTQTLGTMSQSQTLTASPSQAQGELRESDLATRQPPIGGRLASEQPGHVPEPSRGAGASHAWVEVYTPTHGWRGFDPTNNLLASTHHVKMGIGRDYNDVPPTRGTFRGLAEEKLTVEVVAKILDA